MRIRFPHISFSLLLLFALTLFVSSSGLAQDEEKEKAQKQTEKRQELERQTLAMLDEVATQAMSLKLPENRSFVLAGAADLLWKHDEKRARNLFWDALNNLIAANAPTADELKDPAGKDTTAKDSAVKHPPSEKVLSRYYLMFSARQEFLRKVAQHDPQLAMDM